MNPARPRYEQPLTLSERAGLSGPVQNQSVATCLAGTVRDSDISVVFEAGSTLRLGFRAYCLPEDIAQLVEGAFRIGYDAPGVCVLVRH